MLTTDTIAGLNAEQVKALRNADGVSFHYDHADGTVIVATRGVDPGDGFGKRKLRVDVPVEDARFTVYERGGDSGRREPTHAFWNVGSAKFNEHWSTVARFLRAGDILKPHWTAGNSTERLRDLGFTSNHFTLMVIRSTGKERKIVTNQFLLGYETVPVGNDFTIKF